MKHFKRVGGVLLALTMAASISLTACDFNPQNSGEQNNEQSVPSQPAEKVVSLVGQDASTYKGNAAFSFADMFTATVDGEPYALTEANIDSSSVNLSQTGTYTVTCSITVDGKQHQATAHLTVHEPRSVFLGGSDGDAHVGEEFDFTQLFTVTVDGEPYTIGAGEIDSSEVDMTQEGEYEVTLSFSVDGKNYSLTQTLYVHAQSSLDLASALAHHFDNFTLNRDITEVYEGEEIVDHYVRKAAAKKYFISVAGSAGNSDQYCYRCKADGTPARSWYFDHALGDNGEWRDPYAANGYEYVYYPDLSQYTEDDFTLEGGWFCLKSDLLFAAGVNFFGAHEGGEYSFTSVRLQVRNGKLYRVEGITDEATTFEDVYSDYGTTDFEIVMSVPEVSIEAHPAECFVGETFENWAKMFSVTIDKKAYTLTATDLEGIDSSAVKFDTAGVYDVTLTFTAEDAITPARATAKFTVKELPTQEVTFAEALQAAAENCTVAKTSSVSSSATMFYWNGNHCYTGTESSGSYYIIENGTIQMATVSDGTVGAFSTKPSKFPRIDLIAAVADDFVEGADGLYTYDGAKISEIFAACWGIGVGLRLEASLENGEVKWVKLVYKSMASAKTESYYLYTISLVGTTELPVSLPE